MRCANCGNDLAPDDSTCSACGQPVGVPAGSEPATPEPEAPAPPAPTVAPTVRAPTPTGPPIAGPPTIGPPVTGPPLAGPPLAGPPFTGGPGATRPTLRQRAFADRPLGYPNPLVWLRSGILRDWRGPVGALVSTWFYLPVAVYLAGVGAVVFGVGGLVVGGLGLHGLVPEQLHSAPVIGTAIDGFLSRSGGIVVGLLGLLLGAVGGFVAGLVLPWAKTVNDPLNLAGALLGIVVSAALLGVGYTLYRVVLERWLLHVAGARRLSWRESQLLTPILRGCARDLGLPNVPRLLIDDRGDSNAYAYTRHLVVNKGLLEEFDYHTGAIAAVLSHELVHWRNGDAVTSAFVRGVALPLYLVYSAATWVMRKFPHPLIKFLIVVSFWPVLVTVKYVVMPLQAMDTRRAELRADQGAVLTGHRAGMRRVLGRHRSFEGGRSGWDEAVCATHPPAELRLEQLEAPGKAYPLPEDALTRERADDEVPSPEDALILRATRNLVFAPPIRGSRTGWAAVGATMLACFLVLGVLAIVQWQFFRPQDALLAYFDALARHDMVAAQRVADTTSGGLGRQATSVLPPDVVRAPDYQPPSQVTVTNVVTNGDDASADIGFRLGDTTQTAQLTLKRNTHATGGIFHGWHIVGGLSELAVTAQGIPTLQVNGVDVATEGRGYLLATAAPGVYKVTVPDNPLSQAPPVSVVVGLNDQAERNAATVTLALKPAANDQISQLVQQQLNSCAQQKVPAPAGCPFEDSFYGDLVGDVRWVITAFPQLEISLASPTDAQVRTRENGHAVLTGQRRNYLGNAAPFSDTVTFSVSGTVSVDGNQLAWHQQT